MFKETPKKSPNKRPLKLGKGNYWEIVMRDLELGEKMGSELRSLLILCTT